MKNVPLNKQAIGRGFQKCMMYKSSRVIIFDSKVLIGTHCIYGLILVLTCDV